MSEATKGLEGGCACGAVRFRITQPLMGLGVCYCRDCQKATGGGPNYVALAPRDALEIVQGAPKGHGVVADSGNRVTRMFCGECGSPLWTETPEDSPFLPVKVGALDEPPDLRVGTQVYTDSARPWHLLHEDVASFPRMPPGPRR